MSARGYVTIWVYSGADSLLSCDYVRDYIDGFEILEDWTEITLREVNWFKAEDLTRVNKNAVWEAVTTADTETGAMWFGYHPQHGLGSCGAVDNEPAVSLENVATAMQQDDVRNYVIVYTPWLVLSAIRRHRDDKEDRSASH